MDNLNVFVADKNNINGLSENSTYNDLVGRVDVSAYTVPAFFKLQNDGGLPRNYWTWLVDVKERTVLNSYE